MSKLRSVNTHFWSDNYVIELDPVDKLIFLYLLTNEHTNMLGVYELHIRKVAFDTGNPLQRVKKAFEGFENDGKIAYVDGHIIMKNFLKHQNLNVNMQKSAINSFNEMPPQVKQHPFCEPITKALEGFIKGSEPLAKYELELELELEEEIKPSIERAREGDRVGDEESQVQSTSQRVGGCPIPEPLQIDGFQERYQQYLDYMLNTYQKRVHIQAVQSHFRRLIELQRDGNDPLKVIDQTMAAGNKSFYPLKDKEFSNPKNQNQNGEVDIKAINDDIDEILQGREAAAETAGAN